MSVFATTSKASASFDNPGDQVTGVVAEIGEPFHANKYQSQEKDYWPSGDPVMNVTVTLKTDQRDPQDPDDEGLRRIFMTVSSKEGGQLRAIKDAVRAAGAKDLAVGGFLTLQFTDFDPESQNPRNPRKLYRAAYQPPAAGGGVFAQEQATPPAQQQSPAQFNPIAAQQGGSGWQQPEVQAAPQGAPGWAQPPAQQQAPTQQAPAQQWQPPQQSPDRQAQVAQAERVAQANGWQQPQQQEQPPAPPAQQAPQGGQLDFQAIQQMLRQGASDQDVHSATGADLQVIQALRANL